MTSSVISGRRRAPAVMAVLLATLFPLIGFVAPAHAAGKVTIANLKLTKSDAN